MIRFIMIFTIHVVFISVAYGICDNIHVVCIAFHADNYYE